MKKNILCAFVALLALLVQARTVSSEEAKLAARAWAERNAAFGVSADAVGTAKAFVDANGVTLWYQVQMGTSCLIVSPVMELEPVIAVLEKMKATGGLPDGHPMRAMLVRDMTVRLQKLGLYKPTGATGGPSLLGAAPPDGDAAPSDPVMAGWAEQGRAKWARLLPTGSGIRLMAAPTNGVDDAGMAAEGMVVRVVDGFGPGGRYTHWNQEEDESGNLCYNYHTPSNYPCGCVATAMSALMQFFGVNATKAGVKNPLYGCSVDGVPDPDLVTMSGGEIMGVPLDGYDYYDWSLVESDEVCDLLGRVAYDAGVMLGMDWALAGSGSNTLRIPSALRGFAKVELGEEDPTDITYSRMRALGVREPSQRQYAKLIYNQCRAGVPVALGIIQEGSDEGHSVLAVGYGWDDEGNERVRIFTGWGGTGDGWYSLPYINTKSLPSQAGNFLFDVVTSVATLAGYENEDFVPLVGRFVGPDGANKTLEVLGGAGKAAVTSVTTDENGFFGVLVSAAYDTYWLECQETGDSMKVSIGKDDLLSLSSSWGTILKPDDVSALLRALPPAINFPYFVDFESAKEVALERGCPLFCVSGAEGGVATNVAEMVDSRFVKLWISDASDSAYDGNPSCAVFFPSDFDPDEGWKYTNGRLSYGYFYSRNDSWDDSQKDADEEEEDEFVTIVARSVVQEGFATICLTAGQSETNDFRYVNILDDEEQGCDYEGDEAGALQAMVQRVVGAGWDEYCRRTQGISLTVTASAAESGTPDPSYGTHVNTFTNGQLVTALAPGELGTNVTTGVVMGFSGWTLTNETTGAFLRGTGTNAEFTVEADDVLTLTWQVVTNAVWIEVEDAAEGTVAPGSGWYPFYQTVTFIATPDDFSMFDSWNYWSGNGQYASASRYFGQFLSFAAIEPCKIHAQFRDRDDDDAERIAEGLATTNTLTVVAVDTEFASLSEVMPSARAFVVGGSETNTVAMDEDVLLPQVLAAVVLEQDSFLSVDGSKWECVGWVLETEDGTLIDFGSGSVAGFTLKEDATLSWIWGIVAEQEERRPLTDADVPVGPSDAGGDATSPITIVSNGDGTLTLETVIANAVAGYWYAIVTDTDLTGDFGTVLSFDYAGADGRLELEDVTVDPTEPRRFYKVRILEDEPTEP